MWQNLFALGCLLWRTAVLHLGIVQGNTPAYLFPALLCCVKQVSFLSGWAARRGGCGSFWQRGVELASYSAQEWQYQEMIQRLSVICIVLWINWPLVGRKQLLFSILRILLL